MKRIWLIGGTSESAEIAKAIALKTLPCLITVTTATARSLYRESQTLKIEVGQLDELQMIKLCQKEQILAIVDASHPYAVAVSQNAIATAIQQQIPYLRYERASIKKAEGRGQEAGKRRGDAGTRGQGDKQRETEEEEKEKRNIIELESFETLINGDYLLGQRVLLTVGYKALPLFELWQNRATLFARILPAVHSLKVAFAAGFSSDRILALRPPVSADLELALWQHWQISLVVTKASGEAGGEEIKRSLAAELGIPLIVIARPKIIYPRQTSDISEVLTFCYKYLKE